MSNWNNLPFVQALGWATLNSLAQMAFLWILWLGINMLFRLSQAGKHSLAVTSVLTGFALFLLSFFNYYLNGADSSLVAMMPRTPVGGYFPILLSAASLTYLILLIVPSIRLLNNWRIVQQLQTKGLGKASAQSQLFVKLTGHRMGIKRTIRVHLSDLISSPVTVGFIKPVILLPLSVLSQLTPHQLEAILIHELAHIRRHDYLTNLVLTCIHAVMYFNPFVKLFLKAVELSRESSCDETVLQFGYDKISYASALLEFEKRSRVVPLAMGAASKNHLLQRIESMVGIPKSRTSFSTHFFAGLATMVLFFLLSSVFPTGKKSLPSDFNGQGFNQPAAFFIDNGTGSAEPIAGVRSPSKSEATPANTVTRQSVNSGDTYAPIHTYDARNVGNLLLVAFDEADAALSTEQKQQVRTTVESTKKVLEHQWIKVDQAIGDAMTRKEKVFARAEYLKQIENIDWNVIENNLAGNFENIDWNRVNGNVTELMATATLDSLENCYSLALAALSETKATATGTTLPMPDVTLQQLRITKSAIKDSMKVIQKIRAKKTIRL